MTPVSADAPVKLPRERCRKCVDSAVGSARVRGGMKHRCTRCGRSWTVRDRVEETPRAASFPAPLPEPWWAQ